ncbi:ExbD/TolR family protein [Planctomicrobium sp. SH668]|uniref:ExbD/TolR family protein n=1 Tax=Planctomicrobium sp. SH668 TaxID=3448126 RepID=UPI003F5C345A
MSISTRKAGEDVTCPQCVRRTKVPKLNTGEIVTGNDESREVRVIEQAITIPQSSGPVSQVPPSSVIRGDHEEEDEEEDEEYVRIGRRDAVPRHGLDMTPMVDVVMLLLIFFMITASFVTQKSLPTTTPEMDETGSGSIASADDIASESIIVSIDEDNVVSLDDHPLQGTEELASLLATKMVTEKKYELLIEVHPLAKHGTVVAVTDAGMTARMQHIRRVSKGDQ